MVAAAVTQPLRLSIDIWSDIVCPWRLIGWANLQRAPDVLAGEVRPQIRWHCAGGTGTGVCR